MVQRCAANLHRQLPASLEVADLEQVGLIGLLEAIRSFNADKGASLATFASLRIHGAMIDEIRRNLWAPRSVFQKARRIDDARRALQNEGSASPGRREIARRLGISTTEFNQLEQDARFNEFFDIENVIEPAKEGANGDPLSQIERNDFVDHLVDAIGQLSERERSVLKKYLQDDKTLSKIGEDIGVTESRVCQIYKQATNRLGNALSGWGMEVVAP